MESDSSAEVFPPGETIRDELGERRWTQADLAEILGRPVKVVNEIITGKVGITPGTAKGLSAAFEGTSAQFWLNLDASYQLSLAHRKDDAVAQRARVYAKVPVREMIRRNWIEPATDPNVLAERVTRFLDIATLDEDASPWPHAARRSTSYESINPATIAWVMRVRHIGMRIPSPRSSLGDAWQIIEVLRNFIESPAEVRNIPHVLDDVGIRFVVVEQLPKTRIDGACLWLDKTDPVIALSLRYDRIDYFWHTLMHELGHVAKRDGMHDENVPLDIDLVGKNRAIEKRPKFEVDADLFATRALIHPEDMDEFIERTGPLYSKKRIIGFANRIHVHPGIVVGQLQFRGEISYAHSRDLLVRIRDTVTQSAITDGWGQQLPATN